MSSAGQFSSGDAEAMRTAFAAHSLIGADSHLPDWLSRALDGAMAARLLRSAQEAGVVGEALDLVEALLFAWSQSSSQASTDPEHPLRLDVTWNDLAESAGWPISQVRAVLAGLLEAGVLEQHPPSDDPWSTGEFAVDLMPLLAREPVATAGVLRRLWSVRHFRTLRSAWTERVVDLERLFDDAGWAERFAGVESLAESFRERWRGLGQARDLEAVEKLFERSWANSESIYALFTELVTFDDLAWILTSRFGLLEPLSRVLYEQAGMRAQVRRDRMLGYTAEPAL